MTDTPVEQDRDSRDRSVPPMCGIMPGLLLAVGMVKLINRVRMDC